MTIASISVAAGRERLGVIEYPIERRENIAALAAIRKISHISARARGSRLRCDQSS